MMAGEYVLPEKGKSVASVLERMNSYTADLVYAETNLNEQRKPWNVNQTPEHWVSLLNLATSNLLSLVVHFSPVSRDPDIRHLPIVSFVHLV
jgi:hypothetical protein